MQLTPYDIVMKIVGPVQPVGETHTDDKRFENLKSLTELVDALIDELYQVARNRERVEYSMKRAGKHAAELLEAIGYLDKADEEEG